METYKCFFCGKEGMIENPFYTGYESRRKNCKAFLKLHGYVKVLAGKVGEKWICDDCRDELRELITY